MGRLAFTLLMLGERDAHAAGGLLAKTRTSDVVDADVATLAKCAHLKIGPADCSNRYEPFGGSGEPHSLRVSLRANFRIVNSNGRVSS